MSNVNSPITIIGAGFSGLTTAYYLSKLGLKCQIYEKNETSGGLISTVLLSYGIAENGALTLMATDSLLNLCKELDVELIRANPEHKKRFFFRQKIRQWPLTLGETLKAIILFAGCLIKNKFCIKPKNYETLLCWTKRTVGSDVGDYFLFPALQGIYAGEPRELSASLIFNKKKLKYRGLFAPKGGMQILINRLEQKLKTFGVDIKYNVLFEDPKNNGLIIWCTGIQDNPHVEENVEVLPLVSATLCFKKNKSSPKGFGCLFPKDQSLNSLGVLFNSNIFSDRARENYFTETWLLGGAKSLNTHQLDDESILELIKKDRKVIYDSTNQPIEYHIKKWNRALPHYSVKLEKALENLKMPNNQYAHGNYVAGIGLSKILENSKAIAERIYNENLRISELS